MEKIRKKRMQIAIAAGGTGGHIFPAIALSEKIIQSGYKVIFCTDSKFNKFMDNKHSKILKNANFELRYVNITRKKTFLGNIKTYIQLITEVGRMSVLLIQKNVSGVVGFGGYVSLPVTIAGLLTFKKVIIHEQNAIMGLANKVIFPFASIYTCGFDNTKKINWFLRRKIVFTGNPIRKEFIQLYNQNINYSQCSESNFNTSKIINIFILGGSQGAASFKNFVSKSLILLPSNIKNRLFVNQQAPEAQIEEIKQLYKEGGIKCNVQKFYNNVAELMSQAHLFIGRSGASTISEIACIGVPSILIPLENSAADHQKKNALFAQKNGGAIVMQEKNTTEQKFSEAVKIVLSSEKQICEMSESIKRIAEPFAVNKLTTVVEVGLLKKKKIDKSSLEVRE